MKENEQDRIFASWLEEHRGLFFKVVRAYASSGHDREDLFQEIARQVWRSVPKFRGESKVSTWIYRIAFYTAIDWSKKETKHQRSRQKMSEFAPLLTVPAASNPRLDWLYEQISQLDRIDRSLTLMMLDGFSYSDISTTLGISESNVGVKLNRIKKRLAETLKEENENGI